MEEKITLNLFYMGLISAILAALCSGFAFFSAFRTQVQADLQQQGELIASAYEETEQPESLAQFAGNQLRITLIEQDGTVLYESAADASTMENHLDRPEVQAALKNGHGSSRRTSDTLGTEDYYYAVLLPSGEILRVACSASNIYQIYGSAVPYLVLAICILMVMAVVFAVLLTRRLVEPIKKLPEALDDPELANDPKRVYPELRPFVVEIQQQRESKESIRQEFTANVSHELKTPLTSISGYAEMIESGMAKEEDVKRFAGTIHREAGRLLNLISDIIRLSRLDEDQTPVSHAPVDLHTIAQECIETLTPSAEKRGISLQLEGDSTVVHGEKNSLWELVYNLTDNAIRYNRVNGTVTVTLKDHSIAVSDTGIGIPPEHQERIFERFYRVDKSHSRATGGTGLGLSIVKHVAERHNAKISLESTVGVGTTITVTFPE